MTPSISGTDRDEHGLVNVWFLPQPVCEVVVYASNRSFWSGQLLKTDQNQTQKPLVFLAIYMAVARHISSRTEQHDMQLLFWRPRYVRGEQFMSAPPFQEQPTDPVITADFTM